MMASEQAIDRVYQNTPRTVSYEEIVTMARDMYPYAFEGAL